MLSRSAKLVVGIGAEQVQVLALLTSLLAITAHLATATGVAGFRNSGFVIFHSATELEPSETRPKNNRVEISYRWRSWGNPGIAEAGRDMALINACAAPNPPIVAHWWILLSILELQLILGV